MLQSCYPENKTTRANHISSLTKYGYGGRNSYEIDKYICLYYIIYYIYIYMLRNNFLIKLIGHSISVIIVNKHRNIV